MFDPDRLLATSRHESTSRYPVGADDAEGLRDAFQNMAPLGIGLVIAVVLVVFLPGVIAPVIAAYGAFALYSGLRAYQRRQVVLHTPTAKVEAAPIGPTELSGRIGAMVPYTAPFSNKQCIFWRVEVWELQVSGSKRRWHQVIFEERLVSSLWLEDDTGRITIAPRGAQLVVAADEVLTIDSEVDGEEGISTSGWSFLETHGYSRPDTSSIWDVRTWFETASRVTIRELSLEVGSTAYVLGTIARAGDVQYPPQGMGGPAVHVHSDTYGDAIDTGFGRISLGALADVPRAHWESVRATLGLGSSVGRPVGGPSVDTARPGGTAANGGRPTAPGPADLPPEIEPDQLVVWRGDGGCPFIIAGQEETELEQHLLANVHYGLTVGSAAFLWGLWQLMPAIKR